MRLIFVLYYILLILGTYGGIIWISVGFVCCLILFHRKWKYIICIYLRAVGSFTIYDTYTDRTHTPKPRQGIISEKMREGRYKLIDTNKRTWYMLSKQSYGVGDILHIEGKEEFAAQFCFWCKGLTYSPVFIKPGFKERLGVQGYAGSVQVYTTTHTGKNETYAITPKQKIIKFIQDRYGFGKTSTLLQGLLIGDTSLFSQEIYDVFIEASLIHLVAVSGGNLVMVSLVVYILFFWLPWKIRMICVAGATIWYATLCGLSGSVVRAMVMCLVFLFATFVGRLCDVWRCLLYVLLLYTGTNPYIAVYDLGFILSVSAVIGIIVLHRCINKSTQNKPNRIRKIFFRYILPTLGASIGTLPVLLYFIGEVNITGIAMNIVLAPIIPAIVWIGLGSLFISKISFIVTYLVNFVYIGAYWVVDNEYIISCYLCSYQ